MQEDFWGAQSMNCFSPAVPLWVFCLVFFRQPQSLLLFSTAPQTQDRPRALYHSRIIIIHVKRLPRVSRTLLELRGAESPGLVFVNIKKSLVFLARCLYSQSLFYDFVSADDLSNYVSK